jgi:hypothetical protein
MAHRIRIIALAIIIFGIARSAFPQQSDSPVTQPSTSPARVQELIEQLGSDEWRQREQAQQHLVGLGAAAVDALAKAAASDDVDPEVKSRAAAALSAIRAQDTDGPSLLTMHLKDVPAQQVLDTIAEQAHMRFNTDIFPMPPARRITIDADAMPFWHVMEQLCSQLGVCPMFDDANTRQIRLQPMPQNWLTKAPHQVVGPFIVSILDLHRSRNIDLTGARRADDRFGAMMTVYAEPKVLVAQMSTPDVTDATDDAGNSLVPPPPPVPGVFFNRRTPGQTIEVPLLYPANPGKRITLLGAKIKLGIGQNVERYQVDDLLGAMKVSHALGGRTIEVQVSKTDNDNYTVTVTMKRGAMSDEQWIAMTSRAADIALEDTDGKRMTVSGWSGGGGGGTSGEEFKFTGHYTRMQFNRFGAAGGGGAVGPQRLGEPTRLVWDVPTKIRNVIVPVEFRDLPMP